MTINKYESNGRKLLVEFRCFRCKKTDTRPLAVCVEEAEDHYRDLYNLRPPTEWEDGGFHYPLFCPDCKKAYKEFMNNER